MRKRSQKPVGSVESCHGRSKGFCVWLTAQRQKFAALISEPLSCPGPQGGTHHKVSWMWEVIENSTRGADGSRRCGSICSTKWCKHNTQGVRDTILPCDDSVRGCRGDSSWTNCEIVHVSRSFGQGDRGKRGWWGRRALVTGGRGNFWAGAVVSLPTELHSGVSRCCLLTKMAPNASACEIPC